MFVNINKQGSTVQNSTRKHTKCEEKVKVNKEAHQDARQNVPSQDSEVEVLRFTRALFGLVLSPFLLGGVIECHLEIWERRMPELVAELRKSLTTTLYSLLYKLKYISIWKRTKLMYNY